MKRRTRKEILAIEHITNRTFYRYRRIGRYGTPDTWTTNERGEVLYAYQTPEDEQEKSRRLTLLARANVQKAVEQGRVRL